MVSESRSVNRASAAEVVVSSVPPVQVTPPQVAATEVARSRAQGVALAQNSPPRAESAEEGESSVEAAPKPLDREQAEVVAAEIEQALNESSSTVIKFNVSLVEENAKSSGSSSSFKFQVVERETGKVVRQFPPEDILNVRDRIKATPPRPGVFVDNLG